MQFRVDEQVVHLNHGVGRIAGIVTNAFAKAEPQQYYEVVLDQSTVWVPVAGTGVSELRALTPRRDLERYRAILRARPTDLVADHRQRRLDLLKQLKSGTFDSLCMVVRDLTARARVKPLNELDSLTLRQAHANLSREWSAADGLTLAEAARHIEALLLEGQTAAPSSPT